MQTRSNPPADWREYSRALVFDTDARGWMRLTDPYSGRSWRMQTSAMARSLLLQQARGDFESGLIPPPVSRPGWFARLARFFGLGRR